MDYFTIIDLTLLGIFVIVISIFLYRKRKNLKKDGWLLLYRTKWGMKVIDNVGKKYKKTLGALSYVVIGTGYLLMVGMIYLLGKIVYLYVAYPSIVRAIKIPPITPLVPYLPQAFKLDFLPSFYFIYWIVILAIIAITHEFAHGIFMRRYKIKIKSTGFGFFPFFLPIFLAAFVEQDEKSMKKSKNFHQMAVLAAGTFANVVVGILSFIVMFLFFSLSFAPSGAEFNTYSYSVVAIPSIISVNNIPTDNPNYDDIFSLINAEGFSEIKTSERTYIINKDNLETQRKSAKEFLVLYDYAPAILAGIDGAIVKINNVPIRDWEDFGKELAKYSPGENITLTTKVEEEFNEYEITLMENPSNPEKALVGVGYIEAERKGFMGKVVTWLSSFKKQHIHYEAKFKSAMFIYNFLWWLVLISFSVALVNMLPMGIFDGGRFFYLTILGITKNKKRAELWFKISTNVLLFLFLLLMVFWGLSFFVA